MMMKEVLILALVVWMAMSAHTRKPPDYESKNDADTSVLVDKPSSPTNRTNFRTRRNYMLHGHDYWDYTGPNKPRQLRNLDETKETAWKKCERLARTKKNRRTLRNYIRHGYWDHNGQEISRQLRGRTNRKKTGNKAVNAGKTANADAKSFEDFKNKFKKTYTPKDEDYRKSTFLKNLQEIEKHNRLYKSGERSYEKHVSRWSDMTNEQFRKQNVGCAKPPDNTAQENEMYETDLEEFWDEPEAVDYSECGALNPIRHQGYVCGSCWAFSAVSSIESQIFLEYGKRLHLSEQEMIDCSPGNCAGGSPSEGIQYYIDKQIALEDSYPYTGKDGECNTDVSKTEIKVSGMLHIPKNDLHLLNALVNKGPITVVIPLTKKFHEWKPKDKEDVLVLDDELCNQEKNKYHAMTLVGYGTTKNNEKYWLLRNSYGEDWGDEGYVKLNRDKENHCKITENAYIPVIDLPVL